MSTTSWQVDNLLSLLTETADDLAVPAVRYALGRRSHVVEQVAQRVHELLPQLSTRTVVVLERDLRLPGPEGDDADRRVWAGLLQSCRRELRTRGWEAL